MSNFIGQKIPNVHRSRGNSLMNPPSCTHLPASTLTIPWLILFLFTYYTIHPFKVYNSKFLVYSPYCTTITTIYFSNMFISPKKHKKTINNKKKTPTHYQSVPFFSHPPFPIQPWIYFLSLADSVHFHINGIIKYIIFSGISLKVHECCTMYQYVITFNG